MPAATPPPRRSRGPREPRRLALAFGAAFSLSGAAPSSCDAPRAEAPRERPLTSPNASILPSPLTSAGSTDLSKTAFTVASAAPTSTASAARPATAGSAARAAWASGSGEVAPRGVAPEALPVARPMRVSEPLPVDMLSAREAGGVSFGGEWRWLDAPSAPKAPEVSAEGLAAARRLTALRWSVSLAETGRMRVSFDGRAFPLPLGTELRARADRFGHALVFPAGREYRTVPAGALRALFGDLRLDVTPLVTGEVRPRGAGAPHHGAAVRRVDVISRLGTLHLDTVRSPEAGFGAVLLCRMLVELVAVDPTTPACAWGELPVRAHYTWPSGGSVLFEAGEISRQKETPPHELLCPPSGASFAASATPPTSPGVLLTRDEAAAFRRQPVDTPPPGSGAPAEGLVVRNGTDGVRALVLDGVPVAWVLPGAEHAIVGLSRGRYVMQGRSFLGDTIEAPRTIELPARLTIGESTPTPVASTSASTSASPSASASAPRRLRCARGPAAFGCECRGMQGGLHLEGVQRGPRRAEARRESGNVGASEARARDHTRRAVGAEHLDVLALGQESNAVPGPKA